MADVLVTAYTPVLGAGRALRTYAIAAALARSGPVKLVYQRFGAAEPDPVYAGLQGVELIGVEPSRRLTRLLTALRARRAGAPLDLARGVSRELGARAVEVAVAGDRLICDGPIPALALSLVRDPASAVYSAQNLEIDIDPRMEAVERYLLGSFGETWLPTHRDMDGAAALDPTAALRYAPNVVDVGAIEIARDAPEPGRVLYAADFSYAPNREGLRFLLDAVMPVLWRAQPAARLIVCGKALQLRPDDERIEALGFVEDIAEQYARAAAVAVPLLSGGGSPLKLIEALAYGKAVVATAHAARLIESSRPGRDLLVADDGEQMAAQLASALAGEHPGLARAARALAEREYSIEALAALLAP